MKFSYYSSCPESAAVLRRLGLLKKLTKENHSLVQVACKQGLNLGESRDIKRGLHAKGDTSASQLSPASSLETRFSRAKIQDDHVIVVNVISILSFPRATPAGHDEQEALEMSMN